VWVVAVGRLFAGIRGAMVVAAGAIRFNFVKFVIADGLAAVVSGGMFIALGYWAGKKLGSIAEMRERIKGVEHWVFLGVGLVVALVFLVVWIRRKKHRPTVTDIALDRAAERAAAERSARHGDATHPTGNGDLSGERTETRR
jgi:membrane protein DedA with SNARE-associated domain